MQLPTLHAPTVHDGVPFATAQTTPHVPQLVVDALVLVSQPSTTLPLQLPKPALHAPTAQLPLLHAGVPFAVVHTSPQVPQFEVEMLVFTSQPSAVLPLQLPKPVSQPMPHVPAEHIASPLMLLHTVAQVLQCAGSVSRFTSQPLARLPSQFA